MNTYTKINTSYKRYQNITKDNCPNEKWLKWRNQIILGDFSDPTIEYLKNCLFEGYEKIDGTNSKICFYPSNGSIAVGGKTDKAVSQHGQFEMLQEIANRIQPKLCELFPKETAKYSPIKENGKIVWSDDFKATTDPKEGGTYNTILEEVPIYIYGEYFGQGIQKGGGRYLDHNDFVVFDIDVQGWWLPKEMRDKYCEELGLKQVPFIGTATFTDFEQMVATGFNSTIEGIKDNTLMAEGIVARPVVPIKDSRGNRVIVKIKSCDYISYNQVRNEFTDDEFNEFNEWYKKEVEPTIK